MKTDIKIYIKTIEADIVNKKEVTSLVVDRATSNVSCV